MARSYAYALAIIALNLLVYRGFSQAGPLGLAATSDALQGLLKLYVEKSSRRELSIRDEMVALDEELAKRVASKLDDRNLSDLDAERGASDTIRLNVGGDARFATRRDTFTSLVHSRLSVVFTGKWSGLLPRDADGRIFLDVDPKQFRVLLDWMAEAKQVGPRTAMNPPSMESLPLEQRWGFMTLCKLLGVPSPRPHASITEAHDASKFIPISADATLTLSNSMLDALGKLLPHADLALDAVNLTLLYRGSRDGFEPSDFQERVAEQQPTLVVAKSSDGQVFGGYTDGEWALGQGYRHCQSGFLFSMGTDDRTQPSKHHMQGDSAHCMLSRSFEMASFGDGDMSISWDGVGATAVLNVGNIYSAQGSEGTADLFSKSGSVGISELEVFKVVGVAGIWHASSQLNHIVQQSPGLTAEEMEIFQQMVEFGQAAYRAKTLAAMRESRAQTSRNKLDDLASFVYHLMGGTAGFPSRLSNSSRHSSPIVTLNVRGVIMMTFRSTLLKCGDSALAERFQDDTELEEVDGGAFLDEDPALFAMVLQFLRLSKSCSQPVSLGANYLPVSKSLPFQRLLSKLRLADYIKTPGLDTKPGAALLPGGREDDAAEL